MTAPDGYVQELLERLRRTSADLDAMAVQQRAEWDQARAGWAVADEARAKAARAGELGPQWVTLQQRIDLGETSVDAVVRGRDESPEAESVMTDARRKATELEIEVRERDAEGELPAAGAQRAAMRELDEALDDLRAFVARPDAG